MKMWDYIRAINSRAVSHTYLYHSFTSLICTIPSLHGICLFVL
jgi:hypothetical protein